jgi:hypothetical protein
MVILHLVTTQSCYTGYFTSCHNTKLLFWLIYILLQNKAVRRVILHLVTTQSCYTGYFTHCCNKKLLHWLFYILLHYKFSTSYYNTKLLYSLLYILLQHKVVTLDTLHLVTTQSYYSGYFTSCSNTKCYIDYFTSCYSTKLLH